MNPDDKIDLSSVNKTKKQFKLPKLKNPFKKNTAGPGRDEFGQFASGSGGLSATKHFNWKRAAPLVVVVALIGGFLVFKSFAGTYRACTQADIDYNYAEECVTKSDEAALVRLYYGIFNRAPDQSGLDYWSSKLIAKKATLTEVARQFMGSSEFKNKYGKLSDQAFVKAMYPQVFGRAPDSSGLAYWTNKLTTKKVTRESLMTQFTQSGEMQRNFASRVALALGVDLFRISSPVATLNEANVTCNATVTFDSKNTKWCGADVSKVFDFGYTKVNSQALLSIPIANFTQNLQGTQYDQLCFDLRVKNVTQDPNGGQSTLSVLGLDGGVTTGGKAVNNTPSRSVSEYNTFNASHQGRSCINFIEVNNKVKELLILVSGEKQPAGAEVAIALSNIGLRSTKEQPRSYAYEQGAGTIVDAIDGSTSGGWSPTSIRGAELRIYSKPMLQRLNPNDAKPHWVQKTDFQQGKARIDMHSEAAFSEWDKVSKVSVRLTDIATGSPVKFKLYQRSTDSSTGKTTLVTQDSTAQPFTVQQDGWNGEGDFWIEFESTKPIKLKFEADWVSGPVVYNSDSQYYKSWISDLSY